jgi:endonuclease YncB( thermonuclease family)
MRLAVLLFAFILPYPLSAQATEIISGKVVAVADGDTLTVLTYGNRRVVVRLAGIDAPEKGQSYGQRSKQSLSDLCLSKTSSVTIWGHDKYRRALGYVTCGDVSASDAQVAAGMAWVYRQYSDDPGLLALEGQARARRRGLWGDRNPVPPWEFRRRRR